MLLSPNNPTGIEDEIRHCLTEGRNWQGDLACRKRSGQDYTVRASITPVFDQNGQVRHFLAIHEDVTAVREEQERRRTLEAKLFQAQKMETIGTLAGGIAHDFNNILTGILGFTEMAGLSLPEDHPAHQDLTEVRKAGNRAKELVAQILTFSRQTHVQAVPLELAEATDEALKLIRASTPATIELVRELSPGRILADHTAIHQVVLNLCTNAVHAMRGKVGRLTVRVAPCSFTEPVGDTHPRLKPGGYMCLTISDTGHGMDDATLNRLFEPFFTTKKPGEGTGLGLALVRGIVADHSGGMRVTSQVGKGTTFQIFMPVCLETRDPKPLDEPVVHGGGETVAVIDDESSIATFVSSRLEQLNYRPVVFHSAPKAHEALMASPGRFQALVTDLTMPQITGSELLRQLRAAGIGIPAVLMTGVYFEDTVDDPVAHLSRTVILRKPFDGDDLARAVHECLATPLG
jgi:signal transduction histidine kinase/ActR/RegA family two-component response regulator